MNRYLYYSIFCVLLFFISNDILAQVIINEGSNRNYNTLRDEDNEYNDWIELYNPGSDTVNLYNYSLTDDSTVPAKWKLPTIKLAPRSFRVIYCSGKDRKPTSGFTEV